MELEIFSPIHSRQSTRSFNSRPIPKEDLKIILKAGTLAPSAKNRQPWQFVVLSDPESIRDVLDCFEVRLAKQEKNHLHSGAYSSEMEMATATAKIMRQASAVVFVQYAISALHTKENMNWEKAVKHFDTADIQSIGAAIQNMHLQATYMNISSLWVCDTLLAHDEICRLLGMEYPFIATVLFGYESPRKSTRIDAEEKTVWIDKEK